MSLELAPPPPLYLLPAYIVKFAVQYLYHKETRKTKRNGREVAIMAMLFEQVGDAWSASSDNKKAGLL
jgi:hypothetical protein